MLFKSGFISDDMWTPTSPAHTQTWPRHHLHVDMCFLTLDPTSLSLLNPCLSALPCETIIPSLALTWYYLLWGPSYIPFRRNPSPFFKTSCFLFHKCLNNCDYSTLNPTMFYILIDVWWSSRFFKNRNDWLTAIIPKPRIYFSGCLQNSLWLLPNL